MAYFLEIEDACAGHPVALEELRQLRAIKRRYLTVQTMEVKTYAAVRHQVVQHGKDFDEIADRLAALWNIPND